MIKRWFAKNKNSHLLPILAIIIFYLVTFSSVIFGNKTLLTHNSLEDSYEGSSGYKGFIPSENTVIDPGGSAWIDEPLSQINSYKIFNNKVPIWNEFSGAGKPLFANQTSNAFSFLRYIFPVNIFPSPLMWDLFLIFRLIVLSILFYIYLRLVNFKIFSSFLSSILLGLCGHCLMYINLFQLDVEVFTPLIFISMEIFFKKQKISILLIPVSVLILMVGGNIQSSIIIILSAILYYICRSFNVKKIKSFFIDFLFFLILLFSGILISSFYLIPFIEFFLISFNAHSLSTGLIHYSFWNIPGFFTLFINGPIHSNWNGFSQNNIPSFFGTIPILIVIYIFFINLKNKSFFIKNKIFFASLIIFIFFLFKSFGIFPFNFIGEFPVLNRIIFTKYIIPLYFSFFVIFTYCLEKFIESKKLKKIYLLLIFVFILLTIGFNFFRIIGFEYDLLTKFTKIKYFIKNCGIEFGLFGLFFIYLLGWFDISIKMVKILFISFFCLFINYWNIQLFLDKKWDRYGIYDNPADYVSLLQERKSEGRIYGIERSLLSQIGPGYGLYDLRDFDALLVDDHINFMRNFVTGLDSGDYPFYSGGNNLIGLKSLDYLESVNVKFLLIPTNRDKDNLILELIKKGRIKKIFSNKIVNIYQLNPNPKVFLPSKISFVNDYDSAIKEMNYVNFNPKENIVVYKNSDNIECNSSQSFVSNIIDNGDFLSFDVETACDKSMVFISNTFYPGWHAYIEGIEVPIYKSNIGFQSIEINNIGKYKIVLKYSPFSFKIGIFLSALTMVGLVITMIFFNKKK